MKDVDDIIELDSKRILEEYAKKIFSELTGREIDFSVEIDDDGIMKIYNATEADGKFMANIVNTIRLRAAHITEEEYEQEENQGVGSEFNRSARSYVTH